MSEMKFTHNFKVQTTGNEKESIEREIFELIGAYSRSCEMSDRKVLYYSTLTTSRRTCFKITVLDHTAGLLFRKRVKILNKFLQPEYRHSNTCIILESSIEVID